MVAEQQHLRSQLQAAGEERPLLGPREVAGQQDAPACDLDAKHQGAFVANRRPEAGRRPQHLHPGTGDRERRSAEPRRLHAHVPRPSDVEELPEGRIAGVGEPEPLARHGAQHGGKPTPVVRVGVARHDQVEATHAERRQCREHDAAPAIEAPGRGGASVDEEVGPAGLHEDGVALADVQEHDTRRRGLEARSGPEDQHGHDDEGGEHPPTGAPAEERNGADSQGRRHHEGRRAYPRRGREARREPVGRAEQPAGDCREPVHGGAGRRPRRQQRRRQGERKQHAHERNRHQVHQQPEGRDPAQVQCRQRRGGEQRCRRDVHQRPSPTAQPGGLRRGRPAQGRGRGEGELGARGEECTGLGQEKQRSRGDQPVQGRQRPPPKGGQGEGRQQDPGAPHRELGAGQQRVARGDEERAGQGEAACVSRSRRRQERAQGGEHQARHQRQVQAGHREQMGEAQLGDGVAGLRCERPRLPQRQRGQQGAAFASGEERIPPLPAPAGDGAGRAPTAHRHLEPLVHEPAAGCDAVAPRADPRARRARVERGRNRPEPKAQPQPAPDGPVGQRQAREVRALRRRSALTFRPGPHLDPFGDRLPVLGAHPAEHHPRPGAATLHELHVGLDHPLGRRDRHVPVGRGEDRAQREQPRDGAQQDDGATPPPRTESP